MEVQPQLVLLQKTLFAIEGLGRQIYPELDLWKTAKPFLEKWVKEQIGIKNLIRHCRANIPFIVEQLPYIPKLMHEVLLLGKQNIEDYAHKINLKPAAGIKKRNFFVQCGILAAVGVVAYQNYHVNDLADINMLLYFFAGIGLVSVLNKFDR